MAPSIVFDDVGIFEHYRRLWVNYLTLSLCLVLYLLHAPVGRYLAQIPLHKAIALCVAIIISFLVLVGSGVLETFTCVDSPYSMVPQMRCCVGPSELYTLYHWRKWMNLAAKALWYIFSAPRLADRIAYTLTAIATMQRGPPHIRAESFTQTCPPNFRFYPNYEQVLGMPAPLYHDLHPPFHVVYQYYRATQKCWHPDKRNMWQSLSDAQWEDITTIIEDSYKKLMYRESKLDLVWPRLVNSTGDPTKMIRPGVMRLEDSTFWNQRYWPTEVDLYAHGCKCSLWSALRHALVAYEPTSEETSQCSLDTYDPECEDLKHYCPCSLGMAIEGYRWFWEYSLPPLGVHDWYLYSTALSPTTSLFDAFLYLLSRLALRNAAELPDMEKVRLCEARWLPLEEFWASTQPGGSLYEYSQAERLDVLEFHEETWMIILALERAGIEDLAKKRKELADRVTAWYNWWA